MIDVGVTCPLKAQLDRSVLGHRVRRLNSFECVRRGGEGNECATAIVTNSEMELVASVFWALSEQMHQIDD